MRLHRSQIYLVIFLVPQAIGSLRLSAEDPSLTEVRRRITQYSGIELIFDRHELPTGRYHDIMKPLARGRRIDAARVCLKTVQRYPFGYLRTMGLCAVGVFEACASRQGDRYHTFDEQLGGYRYFGVYNGNDAIAAAFYSNGQLEMTLHHEIFHHVDSTCDGVTSKWMLSSDDARYRAAIAGMRRYRPPVLSEQTLSELRRRCRGLTLRHSVSQYAAKNPREDQAETARHFMTNLADSLVQVVEKPELPGSQRILHLLSEYENATDDGPDVHWFVDVALDQTPRQLARRFCLELRGLVAGDPWNVLRLRLTKRLADERSSNLNRWMGFRSSDRFAKS